VQGLGARSAAKFRAAGWPVAEIGGIKGRYRVSTVYYDTGQYDAARELMRQFPAIGDIEPRSRYPELPGDGLTVVVTRDFQ
ncbi:MAG: LytR C-terminal domain-containing protein, partial [Mycobacteriales bacterium]